jgi:hypothetical protein
MYQGINTLDNGGMIIWQRGTTASSSDDTYYIDRWNTLTQTAAVSAARNSSANWETGYAAQLKQYQAAAQRMGIEQIVPVQTAQPMRGQPVTFQARVYQDTGGAALVNMALLWWSGTADTVTSDVVNDWTSSGYSAGGFFTSTSTVVVKTNATSVQDSTYTTISLSASAAEMGAATAANNNLILLVWTGDAFAQNKSLYVSSIDCFIGGTIRPFVSKEIARELNECQRYMQVLGNKLAYESVGFGVAYSASSSGFATIYHQINPNMRVAPAFSQSAVQNFAIWTGAEQYTVSGLLGSRVTSDAAQLFMNVNSSEPIPAGRLPVHFINNGNAAYKFYFNAEL